LFVSSIVVLDILENEYVKEQQDAAIHQLQDEGYNTR